MDIARELVLRESVQLPFRAEFFNCSSSPIQLTAADLTGAGFGAIETEANTGPVGSGTPRQLQLLLELSF